MIKNTNGNVTHVKCSSCGKEKQLNPMVLASRTKKYGSIEGIEKNWVCKGCIEKTVGSSKSSKKPIATSAAPREMGEGVKDVVTQAPESPVSVSQEQSAPMATPPRGAGGKFISPNKTPNEIQ